MKQLRLFIPIFLAVPALAACGSSSGSSGAASAQAKAIASAEAQGAAKASSSPSADAPAADASSAGGGSDTCPDQTINGYKITDVLLTEGATCAQLSKVAASPQIGGTTLDWPVDGFNCAAPTPNLISCDLENSQAEINFTATKQ